MENRALRVSWIIVMILTAVSIVAGILLGFLRGRTALGFVLCVGVPAVLASPAAAFRTFERRSAEPGGNGQGDGRTESGSSRRQDG
jgi:hypothetical protein